MPNETPIKPIEPTQEEPQVEIKVMPEEFYFKKMKVRGEGGPKLTLIFVMVGAVILLMAGAAYLFIQSLEKAPPPAPPAVPANVAVNVPPVNEVPVNVPPPPPAPVCGNGTCETDEDSTNCPDDCLPPPPPQPAVLPIAADTDDDGLTDTEENLYSTLFDKSDTDNDGYRDGLEVINLYNPAGLAPQKIEETDLVKVYSNPTYNYTIFYPSPWLARAIDETNEEIMFTSATGEFIEVIVEENPERQPLLDWYLTKSPGVSPAEVGAAATKGGLLGIKSPDGLTVYFAEGDKIFAISYNVGIKTELNYKSAFEMMVKSFKL